MTAPNTAHSAPHITVALPTYRRESLARTLSGLAAQSPSFSFEVIVVDNDSGRFAEKIVQSHAQLIAATEVRYVMESRTGSSHARNAAITTARADVIAWLDDDVDPQPGWLEALVRPILDNEADVTGGQVLLDPSVPRPAWFDEAGIGGYLTAFHIADEPRDLVAGEYFVTANVAYRTDLLRRSGGFDTALGPRGKVQIVGEDVHTLRKVQRLGARARYVPDAVVIHELPETRLRRNWVLRRAWWQGRSDWILNESTLRERRFGGARVAVDWYATELRRRRGEGFGRSAVRFHALCDTARVAGSLVSAARLFRNVRRETGQPAGIFDR